MGMCFGVKEALARTREIEDPSQVTIYGELVHNEEVQRELARRGFSSIPEQTRRSYVPLTPRVMITAHGVSQTERERLESSGRELLDTTCPLVRRVHKAALFLQRQGYFVVVIGRPGHVEVEGIVGDLARWAVVGSAQEARSFPAPRLGVICQTTTPPFRAREILGALRQANPGKEIRFIDTICAPTRSRQEALERLLEAVQALVVVGGANSNNTRQLGLLAEERGRPWLHVRGPADLDPRWFEPYEVVGLTAGTSTPDEIIRQVHRALLRLGRSRGPGGRQPGPRGTRAKSLSPSPASPRAY
jgi:4-hydroxy-3-methylbut-2-enyl diphosphate reductase